MTISQCLGDYEDYLRGRRLKEGTINMKLRTLRNFEKSYLDTGKTDLRDAEEEDFILFAGVLRNDGLSSGAISQYLSAVRQFLIWLYKNDLVLNYMADLVPMVKTTGVEKTIFTTGEITLLLEHIDSSLRDRVFFELLYSSALRCVEALNLKWKDVDIKNRTLKVVAGKGERDRYVPLSKTAETFLTKWKKIIYDGPDSYLFPSSWSGPLRYTSIDRIFRKYLKETGLKKKGLTIHSIRHSTATHLLESGADVRYVSELLGHKSMETTVRYTHPTEESQKKAYRMYHPRENAYYREIDEDYNAELSKLRERLSAREKYLSRYKAYRNK